MGRGRETGVVMGRAHRQQPAEPTSPAEAAEASGRAVHRLPGTDWSALMAGAQRGDKDSYRTLLGSITPFIRAIARRVGVDAGEIEDAVQDVLLTIHAVRHTYDPSRPFGPWLVAVARHRLFDHNRHGRRVRARETGLTAAVEAVAGDEPDDHEGASEARRLRAAIAGLPEGQRQAVELLRLQELSLKEASTRSGLSVAALKVAVHRAVKRLRVLLADDALIRADR